MRIVAALTPAGAIQLIPSLGPSVAEVEGVVAGVGPEGWRVLLVRVDYRGGPSVPFNRESVVFPAGSLSGVRHRRLDATRTALLIGGITVGILTVSQGFVGTSTGGAADGGSGNPEPPH